MNNPDLVALLGGFHHETPGGDHELTMTVDKYGKTEAVRLRWYAPDTDRPWDHFVSWSLLERAIGPTYDLGRNVGREAFRSVDGLRRAAAALRTGAPY